MVRPTRRLLIVALVAALWRPAVAQDEPRPLPFDDALQRADRLISSSSFGEAGEALNLLNERDALTAPQRAAVLVRLVGVQTELGDYGAALATATGAEQAIEAAGDERLRIQLALARGSAWRFRGFPLRAAELFETALAAATRLDADDLQGRALDSLAAAHRALGDWAVALDFSERAFAAASNPSPGARFNYLLGRGIAYYEFRDRDAAEQAFTEALDVARTFGSVRSESAALGELGLVAWEFDDDYPRALELLQAALDLAERTQVPQLQATWLNNIGGASRDAGDLAGAERALRRSLALEEGQGRVVTPTLLKNLGQVLAMAGRAGEAEPYLVRAVDEADRQGIDKPRWQARMELGALSAASDPARAESYFREALDVIEEHQASALLEGFRAGLLGRALDRYDPYDHYIRFLLAAGRPDDAFAVAERGRARVFLDSLAAARTQLAADVPSWFRDEETELLASLSAWQTELRYSDLAAERRRALVSSIEETEARLTALQLRLAVDAPALADVRFPRTWSLAETQQEVVASDERLVLYFLGRQESSAWVLGPATSIVVSLPAEDAIAARVDALLPSLESPLAPVDRDARAWLSDVLLARVLEHVPAGAHLTVVPHGILHYLPFEVLAASDGRYLIEHHTVSYAPSVSSLAFLRTRSAGSRPGRRVVAIGNPDAFGSPAAAPAESRAVPFEWIALLKPLPHSGQELRDVAARFGESQVLEGGQATEDALAAAVDGDVGILHVATHALIDESHPERSGLALRAMPGSSDGILQTREVYGLGLDGALVTLSACQTALGSDVTGEGILGLARACFYAGASAVTASLWNVNDASTAEFMASFYDRLSNGDPVDEALAMAKREFIDSGSAFSHPYYWAPFVASGSTRHAVGSAGIAWKAVLPVAVAIMAAILTASFLIVRRSRTAADPNA